MLGDFSFFFLFRTFYFYTLAGFDLATHNSNLLGVMWRRYHYIHTYIDARQGNINSITYILVAIMLVLRFQSKNTYVLNFTKYVLDYIFGEFSSPLGDFFSQKQPVTLAG
jgi:hypothetical protein